MPVDPRAPALGQGEPPQGDAAPGFTMQDFWGEGLDLPAPPAEDPGGRPTELDPAWVDGDPGLAGLVEAARAQVRAQARAWLDLLGPADPSIPLPASRAPAEPPAPPAAARPQPLALPGLGDVLAQPPAGRHGR
jgi:hypothetical protein